MILVIGMGLSGRAAVALLRKQGCALCVFDDKGVGADLGAPWLDRERLPPECKLVVVSPGVAPSHPLIVQAMKAGVQVIGEAALALQFWQPHWACGITGTNGKTTVTELCAYIMQHCGVSATAAGNCGVPLSSLAYDQDDSAWVVELSSFQLYDLRHKFLRAAVWLNLQPDHLDWHGSLAQYAASKAAISQCLDCNGRFLVHHSVVQDWPELLPTDFLVFGAPGGDLFWFGRQLIWQHNVVAELPYTWQLWPEHDMQNLLAALFLAYCHGISWDEALRASLGFVRGEHRCELVSEVAGVRWINDSKGTNPAATLAALGSIDRPTLLIMGGLNKGLSFTSLRLALAHVKRIFAIGSAADEIAQQLSPYVSVEKCSDLSCAVTRASECAEIGDAVVLSPGCASFDQFQNYRHRGEVFRQLVLRLAQSAV